MIDWLTDTLVTTAALIAVILLIRQPVARLFGPGVAYTLWALPIIRLFLPPLVLPASQTKEASLIVMPALAADGSGASALVGEGAGSAALSVGGMPLGDLPWAEIAFAVWLAGAVAFLAWRGWTYLAMRRDLLADAFPLGDAGKVRIVESPAVRVPVAFGVIDKVVALPVGFLRSVGRDEAEFALMHELEHHAANDLAANIGMQPLLALHWFNPLGWLAWRAMRADQEAACDARVMAGCGFAQRERYGRLIASFAAGPRISLAAPMSGPLFGKRPIVHRLRSLAAPDASPRRRAVGRTMVATSALCLPLTATIVYAAPEPEKSAPALAQRVDHALVAHADGEVCEDEAKVLAAKAGAQSAPPRAIAAVAAPVTVAATAVAPTVAAIPSVPQAADIAAPAPGHPAPPAPAMVPVAPRSTLFVRAHAVAGASAVASVRASDLIKIHQARSHKVELTCGSRTFRMTISRDGEVDDRALEGYEACIEAQANRAAIASLRASRSEIGRQRAELAREHGKWARDHAEEIRQSIREQQEALDEAIQDIDTEIADLTHRS